MKNFYEFTKMLEVLVLSIAHIFLFIVLIPSHTILILSAAITSALLKFNIALKKQINLFHSEISKMLGDFTKTS